MGPRSTAGRSTRSPRTSAPRRRRRSGKAGPRCRRRRVTEIAKEPPARQREAYARAKGSKSQPKTIKTPRRDGKGEYVLNSGAKADASLVDVLGKVVAFTPAKAKMWIAEHPDQASKLRGIVPSVRMVLEAVAGAEPEPVAAAHAASIMSVGEYRLLLRCAHPDSYQDADRAAAMELLRRVKDRLIDAREESAIERGIEPLPRTREDLLQRKAGAAWERRVRRHQAKEARAEQEAAQLPSLSPVLGTPRRCARRSRTTWATRPNAATPAAVGSACRR